MISKRMFAKYLTQIKKISGEMVMDGFSHPTTFEIETAIAYCYFYAQKCDIILVETGLGGAKDATNVMTQEKICVFTSISMDHMEFLGNSLEEIGKEKAGIITENSMVVVGENTAIVKEIIKKETIQKNGTFLSVSKDDILVTEQSLDKQMFSYKTEKKVILHSGAEYQIENAALAMEVLFVLREKKEWLKQNISHTQLRNGIKKTVWEGRFTMISKNPTFIVDGAHNEDAAKKLRKTMDRYFTNHKIIYIMGILKDKECKKIIANMVPIAHHVIAVSTPKNNRALPAYDLAQEIQKINSMVTVADSIEEAVEMAYLLADSQTVIVAFGSLSYLGSLTEIVKHKDKIRKDFHGRLFFND
jgi:dihydrofolate synthase/folylpolyglutamate synthase